LLSANLTTYCLAAIPLSLCLTLPPPSPPLLQDAIREFFSECGPIAEVRIAYDRDTGRAKGFAHIQFEELEGAAKAVQLSGETMLDRELYIESTTERAQRE
jgi:RNA recognition motif-containing protein